MTSDARQGEIEPGYRPCVGIALFARDGRVFVGRRRGGAEPLSHAWQMPQGGIDDGEAPRAAALRELYEETNVSPDAVVVLGETDGWLTYDLPSDLIKRAWKGRYRGQTQKWFAFGFLGNDDDIDVERPGGGRFKAEFDDWRWEPLSRVPDLIVPFKRPVYEQVVATFSAFATWRGPA